MSLSVPLTGMNVSQIHMNGSSHNIANANTENFHSQQVLSSEAAVKADGSGTGAQVSNVRQSEQEGVDLAKELTDMKTDEKIYRANAKVLEAQNNTIGSLLDDMA